MNVVHHLNNSRSQRILWLLEELNVPYEIKFYERNPKTFRAPDELKKIHPLGHAPIFTDETATVAESGAIIEYILEKYGHGKLRPTPGTNDALKFSYWMHYAEGSGMPPLVLALIFSKIESAPMPFMFAPLAKVICSKVKNNYIHPQITLHLNFLEVELQKSVWFAGLDFSAADIQMSFLLESAEARSDLKNYPKLTEFLQKIRTRPAFLSAAAKGGPFNLQDFH